MLYACRLRWRQGAMALAVTGLAWFSGLPAHAQNLPTVIGLEATAAQPIVVTNLGSETIRAIVLNFDGTDDVPVRVQDSGPIPAGGQARIDESSPRSMWMGATDRDRVKVFSFNVKTLQEAGITGGSSPSDVVADAMLEEIFFSVIGDPVDYGALARAYELGGSFHGIDQRKAWGGSIDVALDSPSASLAIQVDASISKRVPPAVISDAMAHPARVHGYDQLANPGLPSGPRNPVRRCLTLLDGGKPWHPLHNSLVFKAGCP